MCDLSRRTALVTGAAQGIGYGIAAELGKAGSRVVVADIDGEASERAASSLITDGVDALGIRMDVTDEASIRNAASQAIRRFARIDILVNNAGVHTERLGYESSPQDFERCLDVNLVGVWRVCAAVTPHFAERGGGKIVNIASINGRVPWADTPAYSASKAAVISLTQSLAIRLGEKNINVNAVCPGGIMTSMADAFSDSRPHLGDDIVSERVLKRPLTPRDIGSAVVFFCSDEAENITGQSLNVDGGTVLS